MIIFQLKGLVNLQNFCEILHGSNDSDEKTKMLKPLS